MARGFRERTKLEEELGVSSGVRFLPLHKLPNSYVAMDLETTGLDHRDCGILEIGAVKVIDGVEVDHFHTMIDTEARMSAAARRVNGITRAMLRGAPKTADALTAYLVFAGDLPMMGHNAKKFDRLFLETAATRYLAKVIENEWYDTLELSREVYGHPMKLADLCDVLGVTNEEAHRALEDARATSECYQGMRRLAGTLSTDSRYLPDPAPDGLLSGQVVCLTGNPYDPSKREVAEAILSEGGKISNNVTKKTTLLVRLDDWDSTKVARARELADETGVRTILAPGLFAMLGRDDLAERAAAQQRAETRSVREDERMMTVAECMTAQAPEPQAVKPTSQPSEPPTQPTDPTVDKLSNAILIGMLVVIVLILVQCVRACS